MCDRGTGKDKEVLQQPRLPCLFPSLCFVVGSWYRIFFYLRFSPFFTPAFLCLPQLININTKHFSSVCVPPQGKLRPIYSTRYQKKKKERKKKSEIECHVTFPSLSGTMRFSLRSHTTNTCASCQCDKWARGAQTVFYIISISNKACWWLIKETIDLNCHLKISIAFKQMTT